MADLKTQPTTASVQAYLESRASPEQMVDCKALMKMLKRVTREQPTMWGPSIVGYGRYAYTYASGRSGEYCTTGFAIRGRALVVYLMAEGTDQQSLLAQLGQHKMAKSCLYFKRLADIDVNVLERLVANSVAEIKSRHAQAPSPNNTPSRSKP